MLTREEAIENIVKIIDNENKTYNQEELNSVEWLEELWVKGMGEEKIVVQYIDTVTEYIVYLIIFEDEEEYELCGVFKRGIDIMRKNVLELLKTHLKVDKDRIKIIAYISDYIYSEIKREKDANN